MQKKPTYSDLLQRVRDLEKKALVTKMTPDVLMETEQKLSEIIQGNPTPIFVIDRNHFVTHWNRACETLTGYSAREMIGTRNHWVPFYKSKRPILADLIVDQKPEREFDAYYKDTYKKSAITTGAYEGISFFPQIGDTGRWLSYTAAPLKDKDRCIIGAIVTIQDVTDRKLARQALLKSEERYRILFNSGSDAVFVHHLNNDGMPGTFIEVNKIACELLGYSRDELLKFSQRDIDHPEKQRHIPAIMQQLTREGHVLFEMTHRAKNGKTIPVEINAHLFELNGKPTVLSIVRDITKRKRTEKALRISKKKLQALYSHMISAQEKERKRLAMELHDDLGQALTVLKLRLNSIKNGIAASQNKTKAECDDILEYVDQIIENTRRLSHDLTPPILDELGLSDSLRSLMNNFARHARIEISITMDDIDECFPPMTNVNIYRIFQETLTNIEKHANAERLCVVVRKIQGSVLFQLEDNGRGFEISRLMDREPGAAGGLGLTAMTERVRMLGGTFDINSHPGKGTCICFTLPIPEYPL